MKIRAPAKVNVRLRVVGKRRDGYHLLDTIIVPISLYDDIEICQLKVPGEKGHRQGPRIEVTCDHPSVPSGEKNLAYRAARAFLQTHFSPYRVASSEGGDVGLVTGYYEPLLAGSRTMSAHQIRPGAASPISGWRT